MAANTDFIWGTGRRTTAIARVRMALTRGRKMLEERIEAAAAKLDET